MNRQNRQKKNPHKKRPVRWGFLIAFAVTAALFVLFVVWGIYLGRII